MAKGRASRGLPEGERERILAYLRLGYWRMLGELDRQLHESGLTARQFLLLRMLGEGNPVNARDVGVRLGVTPANVSGLVDRLERKRYLKRARVDEDRRKVRLEITSEGRKALKRARLERDELVRGVLARLSLREQRALLRALEKMVVAPKGPAGPGIPEPVRP